MQVTLGVSLDTAHHPSLLGARAACAGEVVTGPAGFLALLETALGLLGELEAEPIRVAQYAARLERANNGKRFFSESFAVDRVGVGRLLLGWRDELVAAGWSASADVKASPRLVDLADVESVSDLPLAPGVTDRLQAVLAELRLRPVPGLSSVRLREPLDHWSGPWRQVLESLRARGVLAEPLPLEPSKSRGDLSTVLNFAAGGSPGVATGDGSLVILEAESDLESTDLLATWLLGPGQKSIVIDPAGDGALDRALRARGRAGPGSAAPSRWRPALQVLPLAFALHWKPIDPSAIVQFLTLPLGPIPRKHARRLAEALVQAPGVGGPAWRNALHNIETRITEEAGQDTGTADEVRARAEARVAGFRKLIDTWIPAHRQDPAAGMPLGDALDICHRVAQWAGARASVQDDDAALGAAAAIAKHLASALQHHGQPTVTRLFIQAALEDVTGPGAIQAVSGQVGHIPSVPSPTCLLAPVDQLVWADFTEDAAPRLHRSSWTADEIKALAGADIHLDDPLKIHVQEMKQLLSSLKLVRQALVLIVPRRRRGEVVAPHPLLGVIRAAFRGSVDPITLKARSWLQPQPHTLIKPPASAALPRRRLAPLRRWWRLPGGSLPPRAKESYSSLNDLVHHPFQWVLRHHGRLQRGFLAALPDGKRLLGSIAHRLLQELLADRTRVERASRDEVEQWVDARLPGLLEEEGATLLLPGHEPDREQIRSAVVGAACVLLRDLREGGWRVTGSEVNREGRFRDQPLQGDIDLLLETDPDLAAVIDLKWGGRSYRSKEVAEGRCLQLGLYAHLVRRSPGSWPHVAYLIIDRREILHVGGAGALGRPTSANHHSLLDVLWTSFDAAWTWRREQLDHGWVEVTAEGTIPDSRSAAPEGALSSSEPCKFNDFKTLSGWIAEQDVPDAGPLEAGE